VNGDKTKETYAKILTPQEKTIVSVLRQEKMVGGDDPLYMKFCAKLTTFE